MQILYWDNFCSIPWQRPSLWNPNSNVIGSFIAGVLIVLVLEKLLLSETFRLMLLVGLAGSLTTMSALSIESVEMISVGHYSQALINILLNLLLSLMAASLGVVASKYLLNLA